MLIVPIDYERKWGTPNETVRLEEEEQDEEEEEENEEESVKGRKENRER